MKKLLSFLTIFIILVSCNNYQCEQAELIDMFETSVKNFSTAPNYIVINVYDRNSNTEKEICVEFTYFDYLASEGTTDYNLQNIKYGDNCIPIFEFESHEILKKLNFYTYNSELVDSLLVNVKRSTLDSIIAEHYENGYSKLLEKYSIDFSPNYFEHYLYKNKILTFRDCESGYTVIQKIY